MKRGLIKGNTVSVLWAPVHRYILKVMQISAELESQTVGKVSVTCPWAGHGFETSKAAGAAWTEVLLGQKSEGYEGLATVCLVD